MPNPQHINKIFSFVAGTTIGFVVLGAIVLTYSWISSDNKRVLFDSEDLISTSDDVVRSKSDRHDVMTSEGLENILNTKSYFERNVVLRKIFIQLNKRDTVRLFRLATSLSSVSLRAEVQSTAIERLAMLDAEEALREISRLEPKFRPPLVEVTFREWSALDFNASVEYATDMDDLDRQAALSGILSSSSSLSENDLLEVARQLGHEQMFFDHVAQEVLYVPINDSDSALTGFLTKHGGRVEEYSDAQQQALNHIVRAKIDAEGTSAIRVLVDVLSTNASRVAALTEFLKELGDDYLTVAVASGMYDFDREVASRSLAAWAETDPHSALEVASAFGEDSSRQRMQRSVLLSWAESNPTTLLDSLDTVPTALKDWIHWESVIVLGRMSPELATERLLDLPEGERKDSVAGIIAHNWADRDPRAAVDWLHSIPFNENLTGSVLAGILRSDKDMALEMALELPVRDNGLGFEATVIGHVARNEDVNKALDMVNLVRNEETLRTVLHTIGTQLVRQGESSRAMDLVKDQSEEWQSSFFGWVAWTWVKADSEDMIAKLDDLPSDDLRDQYAEVILLQHYFEPFLDTSQLEEFLLQYQDSQYQTLGPEVVEELEKNLEKSSQDP